MLMIPVISQQEAIGVIKNGGVVVVPTETAYGLVADATNDTTVRKIYQIKGRQEAKPILVLVNSLEMAFQYAEFSDKALELAQRYWPGPLTLVVPRHNQRNIEISKYRDGKNTPRPPAGGHPSQEGMMTSLSLLEEGPREVLYLAASLNKQDTTLGIRWTSNPVCQSIITALGRPITAPSANVSGRETCYTIEEIQAQYDGRSIQPDGIVDGGVLERGEVSTVVKVLGNSVEVIREGRIIIKF